MCRVFDLLFYMSLYVLHIKLILTVFRASRGHRSEALSARLPYLTEEESSMSAAAQCLQGHKGTDLAAQLHDEYLELGDRLG